MKKNYWTTGKEHCAEWWVTLPRPQSKAEMEELLHLAQVILAIGEREGVYRVTETRSPNNFQAAPGWTYAEHLEKIFHETGILRFLNLGGGAARTETGILRVAARLCHYNLAGELVEEEVEDLGSLVEQLHPSKDPGRCATSVVPVTINGKQIKVSDLQTPKKYPLEISISLDTDIWFPYVIGRLEKGEMPVGGYDNRELALCHTPRFNRFLANVRQLVLDYGGEWEIADDRMSYSSQITETGIILDTCF
jgi:hypothetical protein